MQPEIVLGGLGVATCLFILGLWPRCAHEEWVNQRTREARLNWQDGWKWECERCGKRGEMKEPPFG